MKVLFQPTKNEFNDIYHEILVSEFFEVKKRAAVDKANKQGLK